MRPAPSSKRRRGRAKRRRWLWLLVATPVLGWLAVIAFLDRTTAGFVQTNLEMVPAEPVAIVFGAGLRGGKPSLILQNRLDGAIDLYRKGKVHKLLLSGDNRFADYNEPQAMRRYALAHRVRDDDIVLDYAGRDTYDTCFRAKNVFGLNEAILVTQAYHAPRAVYTARSLGIDATAYALPNLRRYPGLQLSYNAREYLADLKAMWDLKVTHRRPYIDTRKARNP